MVGEAYSRWLFTPQGWRAVLAALLLFVGAPVLDAQTGTGVIEGFVVDESQSALPGVTVTLAGAALDDGGDVTFYDYDPAFRGAATITVPLEALGDRRLANQNSLNWRASKRFAVGGQRKLEITADLFNAFNANTVLAMTVASGPSFGAITAIMPPRIIWIGATFSF